MSEELEIWATSGTTESSDDLEIILWKYRPSHDEVDREYQELYPEEYEEVGHVNWKITRVYFVGENNAN